MYYTQPSGSIWKKEKKNWLWIFFFFFWTVSKYKYKMNRLISVQLTPVIYSNLHSVSHLHTYPALSRNVLLTLTGFVILFGHYFSIFSIQETNGNQHWTKKTKKPLPYFLVHYPRIIYNFYWIFMPECIVCEFIFKA